MLKMEGKMHPAVEEILTACVLCRQKCAIWKDMYGRVRRGDLDRTARQLLHM